MSLDVAAGETLAIVGASGRARPPCWACSRASTARIAAAWPGTARRSASLTEDALAKRRQGAIGFVFQSFQLLPALTALENVMLPLELAGARTPKRAADWLPASAGRTRRSSSETALRRRAAARRHCASLRRRSENRLCR